MDKKLNIVSLNIPWPANYGGVIDIYYKIKALHDYGVKIILHCFEYERPPAPVLEALCEEVHYYRRRTGLLSNLSLLPYNVYSRKDKQLINNLLKNDYPILFEGLHTCYYLNDRRLRGRFKIFRECNIEHDYYREIGKAERNWLKKCFFFVEAQRFKWFQRRVAEADLLIAVSKTDTAYLQKTFPHRKVEFVPCFHGNDEITSTAGQSDFLLYHGKLSVKENEKAALYLIEHIFSELAPYRCIIAGMDPSPQLLKTAFRYSNITMVANPSVERINKLIRTAQINLLVTFQDTGLKLKLLNSLFSGRHVVVNPMMLAGSGLDELCYVADTSEKMIKVCRELMKTPFSSAIYEKRRQLLFPDFSNVYQAKRIIENVFVETRRATSQSEDGHLIDAARHVSASIVIYNSPEKDLQTVLSCVDHSIVDAIYVIDNAPSDKLKELVQGLSEKVIYIQGHGNIGFGAAHNIAMREAIRQGAKYHVVLNPDIAFQEGVIESLATFMDENPDVGQMIPKIVLPNGDTQYVCKLIPTPLDLIFRRFLPAKMNEKRANQFELRFTGYDKIMNVPYHHGCFLLFRVSALVETGLFDERFFMYPEDIDITRRMHEKYATLFYPEVEVVHAHAAASRKSVKMFLIHSINMIRYFNKWGWFFDKKRDETNRLVLKELHYNEVKL